MPHVPIIIDKYRDVMAEGIKSWDASLEADTFLHDHPQDTGLEPLLNAWDAAIDSHLADMGQRREEVNAYIKANS